MAIFENTEPSLVWQNFEAITKIPRPSKHEEEIVAFLCDFAGKNNFEYKKDAVGNVLIKKKACKSKIVAAPVVLQSHVDMVCEKKAGFKHDFLKDSIKPYIDGEWVKARNTTLGADDGIGVATMMSILTDTSVEHGPLECLFTVDEETGLTGAFNLPAGFFNGKTLINLDSEDEGIIFIGCAGGMDTTAVFNIVQQHVNEKCDAYLISITGLKGGHSGDDIHKGHGNALKIMVNFLWEATEKLGIELHNFEGGNLKNAIPREAFASVLVPLSLSGKFQESCNLHFNGIQKDIIKTEPDFSFSVEKISVPETKFEKGFQLKFLEALMKCPHGVISWSKDIEGLVETSTNLASIKHCENSEVIITTSQRSSIEIAKKNIASDVAGIFSRAGAEIKHTNEYPGWTPDINSPLLKIAAETYNELFLVQPQIKAIHAGLECGLFLEKYPDLDMISIGPTIYGVHSPDERLNIPSVKKFWDLLVTVLQRV
jgi:dipeptidase D